MRIAVTAKGQNLESEMDPRFGRAAYILIVENEPEEQVVEVVDNSTNRNAMGGAGIQAGKTLADRKVEVLLTGFCGPNAFRTLQAAGVKVVVDQSGSVREALNRFKGSDVVFSAQPNAESHW